MFEFKPPHSSRRMTSEQKAIHSGTRQPKHQSFERHDSKGSREAVFSKESNHTMHLCLWFFLPGRKKTVVVPQHGILGDSKNRTRILMPTLPTPARKALSPQHLQSWRPKVRWIRIPFLSLLVVSVRDSHKASKRDKNTGGRRRKRT